MSEETAATTVRASIELALEPARAFDTIAEELGLGLERQGLRLEPGAGGGVREGAVEVGRVIAWEPGRRIALEWRPADWEPGEVTRVEVDFAPVDEGTRVTVAHRHWGRLVGDAAELAGWFAGEVAAPLLRSTAPAAFGDWLTDRRARSTATRSSTIRASGPSWRSSRSRRRTTCSRSPAAAVPSSWTP